MTTKTEWQAVNQALMADDRRRVGEPPAAEEALAYMRGELSEEEAVRVRERLDGSAMISGLQDSYYATGNNSIASARTGIG